MKTIHAILALAFATLFVSAFSFAAPADEPEVEHKIKIKVSDGAELVTVEADDLEVGETHQSFTDSGKEVLLTRTEDGFDLQVDGKTIDIGNFHSGHSTNVFHMNTDGAEAKKVIIRSIDGDKSSYSFVHGEDHHWVEKGDGEDIDIEDMNIFIQRIDPAAKLLESGVLDDLDEETREKILSTLRESSHGEIEKRIVVEVDERIKTEIHEDE